MGFYTSGLRARAVGLSGQRSKTVSVCWCRWRDLNSLPLAYEARHHPQCFIGIQLGARTSSRNWFSPLPKAHITNNVLRA